MKRITIKKIHLLLAATVIVAALIGCVNAGSGSSNRTAPTVLSTVSVPDAVDVAIDGNITATFNEAMDPQTITDTTFVVMQGTTAVTGTVSYADMVATFNPAVNLANNTEYTATLTTGVTNLAGDALEAAYTWSFTTIAAAVVLDTTAPTVVSTVPIADAVDAVRNANIAATFSEAMDQATITATTFTLMQGATAVTGTVSYAGMIATFNPATDLASNTEYTATLSTGVKDLASNALGANYSWSFTTNATLDTTAPTVVSTAPITDAVDAVRNANIAVTFSEAMDPLTLTDATFTLMQGTTAVTGAVSYTGMIATFNPAANLASNTEYTATLSTGVKDLASNALGANYSWSFTTVAADVVLDTTVPTVVSTDPIADATNVAINSNITATFSEAMDPLTLTDTTFTVMQGTTAVTGAVSYTGMVATFNPGANLANDTEYAVTLSTGVTDLASNALGTENVWSFTTVATDPILDTTIPTVTLTLPAAGATGVAINGNVTVTFSEEMNYATIVAANFTVNGESPVAGAVTYDKPNKAAVFSPADNLAAGTTYTATVATEVTDLLGNGLAADKVWTFTTASEGIGPAPVGLGTASSFAILAKTGVSTVPGSAITGDVGLSPAAETYLTGFSQTDATGYATSPQVTGFLYAADMTPPTPAKMTTAISDMELAYTDAAGRVNQPGVYDYFLNTGAGTLNANTLAPGLYRWNSSVGITGDITISGAANDVWIFQITGDLSIDANKSIILAGGAQARNIFWQVAGEVTMQAGAHFEGILLSQTAITMVTGASMNGRLLAQSQVALDQSTVTKPAF